ncbi:MAG: Laminin sub domain 2, partial [Thermoleophilia bacterium]|nr:Laminin sub domain 2 [Thermoleophilia bacterium]
TVAAPTDNSFVTTNVQRRDATYTGGVCAGWSAFANSSPTNAVGSFNETGLTSGRCYEWRLRAVDSVGNESSTSGSGTYVYTLTPPAPVVVGTLAAVGGTGSYHQASPDSTIWFNPTSLGSLTLKVTPFVAETTAHGVTLPTIATSGWAGPAATSVASAPFQLTYAWEAGAAAPGAVTAVARDSQDSATTMTNTIAADGVAPTGVSISYAASNTSDGATSITAALGADAGSGVAGSTLTRQRAELAPGATCGATYAAAVAVGGSLPTLTDTPPTSGCYVYTVTTTDRVGNSQAVSGGIVRIDREAPTGGSLGHVGGIQASSAVLLTLTPPTDISAPAWRVQRRSATYTGGVCGTWSAFTDTGPINPASDFTDTGLTAGTCWEWRLRSVDAVGNEALVASAGTYVYATSPPTVGTVTGSGTGVYQAAPGDTIWFSNRATGSLTLRANPNDPAMAAGGVTLPSITATGWTSPSPLLDASAPFEGAYAWALAAAGPGLVSATLRDGAGNPSTVNATVGLDRDPPAGGAIAYSAASTNAATIALTVTSATDAGSGVASSSITRERADLTAGATCATTWSAPVAVTGLLPTFADTPPTSGCYRYTLTTTDRVGNPAQVVTGGAARLDREAPTGGSVSHVTGLQNSSAVVVTVGAPTDISTPTWRVQRRSADYAGGVCGSWGAFANTGSTLNPTGSFSDTGMLANRCYEWRLRSLDDVGNEAFVAGSGTYVYTLTPPVTPPVGQFIGTVGAGGPGGTVFQSAPGTTIWFNATGSGSLALRATTTEAESSANGVTLPTIAASGWANPGAFNVVAPPYEVSYTWATGAASPGTVTATARDSANTTSSIAGVISADAIPPAGGNIGYSAAPSSVGMTALTVTAPTDAGSGLRSASVTRTRADLAAGATSCGVDSAPVTLQASAASFTDTPATSGCYVYALNAVDNVGIPRTWSGGTVRIDREAPTGGAISHAVGVMGSSAINIAITTPSDLSGLGWRVQRHEAPYVGGVCGAWSTYANIGSTLNPTGTLNDATMLANRCYEWRLRSVDDVGNEALAPGSGTYVYSTTPPAVPPTGSFTGEVGTGGTAGSVYQAAPGATIFFRPNAPAGVLRLRATINVPSDAANGVTFPAIAAGGWSNPIGLNDLSDPFEAQYTWNPGAASPGTIDAKAKNASNVESTVTGVITADGAAPTGALINYPTGLNASGSVTISASGGSDAGSGVATTVVVRQRAELTKDACAATWEAATSVDGELPVVTDTPGASGCYRYAATSTDRVGNSSTAAYGNPVRIDHEAPAGGAVSHAVGAQAASTVLLTVTAPTDRLDVTWRVQRRSSPFANGVCGGWSAFTDIGALDPASFNNAGLVLGTCYEWRLRSVDAAGNETVAAGSGTYLYQLTPTVVAPTVVTVTVPVPFTVTVPVEVTPLHLVLSAAAYSGRTRHALVVPFAATKATTVVLEVRRGTKVVQRITFKAKAGRNVVRLAKLPARGTYTLGITSTSGGTVARDSAKLRVLR